MNFRRRENDVQTEVGTFRRAVSTDVDAIVGMLADDSLGATRENPGDPVYQRAFAAIDADPNQLLAVAEKAGEVIATMQLSFIPGLSRKGISRCQIEAVRVRVDQRGSGLGEAMIRWAIERARERECALVQLTTDATRDGARRFYERLGFAPSHVGMKLAL
ncbi:GNAT family N-acetyltransferase [Allokutzneria sp. NRRL B-24872]|uniref:GNAT family N-acetyltransferase n=1 Tax=Allokutzneria sp. NRRL B-24872 TaxID=1137961 RepID=UPI000A375809